MNTENDQQVIKYTITRLLASREHSRYELAQKLAQRNFNSQLIQDWIEKFAAADIQSDQRFVEMLCRSRVNKGVGELSLRNECRLHKIDADLLNRVLASMQVDWFELAERTLHKKLSGKTIDDARQQQKYYRFMLQRGFSAEQIHYAIQSVKE